MCTFTACVVRRAHTCIAYTRVCIYHMHTWGLAYSCWLLALQFVAFSSDRLVNANWCTARARARGGILIEPEELTKNADAHV